MCNGALATSYWNTSTEATLTDNSEAQCPGRYKCCKSHDICVEVVWCVSVEEAHAINRFADRKDCWDTCKDL